MVNSGAVQLARPILTDGEAGFALTLDHRLYKLDLRRQYGALSDAALVAPDVVNVAKVGSLIAALSEDGGGRYTLRSLSKLLPFTLNIQLDQTKTAGFAGAILSLPLPDLVGVAVDWDRKVCYLFSSDLTQPIYEAGLPTAGGDALFVELAKGGELDTAP
jgi:hypothetical protein